MKKSFKVANILSHCFIPDFIGDNGTVIDCGANHGNFSKWISENTTAMVHAFEADPILFNQLPVLDNVKFHNMAIDGESGSLELHRVDGLCSGGFHTDPSLITETVTVPKISFHEFIDVHGIDMIDLLKLDIEGCELALLENTPDSILGNISQITVEFHDFMNPGDLPRIHAISDKLQSLGFVQIKYSRKCWSNCLYVNQNIRKFTPIDRLIAHYKGWIVSGIKRRITRNSDNIS